MIHNKAGQFLGSEGSSFATDNQGSGDAFDHPLRSDPSSSVKQGLMREPSGRSRAGKEADARASGTDKLADIRDRSRASAAAKYAPAEPVRRERFGGARRNLRAPSASREGEDEPSAPPRASTLSSGVSFQSGVAFGDGGGHVTSGASGGGWGPSNAGAGRRGQKGWGTSGGVIGGRDTGVHEANFEDRNQQNMTLSLQHVHERGASEVAPAGAAADDERRDSPRTGPDSKTHSRFGRSASVAYQGPEDDFDPRRPESAKILNAEDEEEKARLGLPTSFGRLSRKNPWLLNPRSPRMMYWDALVGTFLLFTATFTPYEVAFLGDGDGLTVTVDARFVINRIVDLGFLMDMGFNFFLPYQTSDNRMITDHPTIVRKYLFGWFPLDCVSIVPYDLIGAMMQDDSLSNLKVLRAIRLLRLAKLLRIIRLGRLFRRFEATHEVNYAVLALNKFGFGILFLAHWMACLFYLIAATEAKENNWVTGYFDVSAEDGLAIDKGSLYVASVYWAVATLSTLGYGDVIPATNAERLYAVAGTFVGGAVYAYLLGSVCSIITNLDEGSNTFYRQMDELNRFMKEKSITTELRVKLRDYFRFRRNSRALVEWSGVMHLMSDALRLDVAEEVFGGWIRAMPIFRDCPKRLPAMLSAHLSSLVLSPHENIMANPVRRDSLFIVEKGLVAHRGKIQETGSLLGIERIYKAPGDLLESSPPAVTLCHAVVLCLKRDALLGVVAEFPETQRQMRAVVCRLIMKETILAYARAVVESVREIPLSGAGPEKPSLDASAAKPKTGSLGGSVRAIKFILGEHLAPSISSMAEKHRLHLMARERPERFDEMERATLCVQRLYRGHVARRALRAALLSNATPGARAMFSVLLHLRLHKHVEEFRSLGLERRHLAATSALELCQVTSLPFADAADVILRARALERENPSTSGRRVSESGDAFKEVVHMTSPKKNRREKAPRSESDDDVTLGEAFATPAFSAKTPGTAGKDRFFTPAASDAAVSSVSSVARDATKKRKPDSRRQSSKEVFAARAFAKPEDRLGLTVLLAAAKFREGGERRRARRG